MKIFELRTEGEKEWMAANTVIEALQFYCNLTEKHIHDFDETDTIEELPKEKWSEYNVVNPDYDPEDPDDWVKLTFEEWMKDIVEPDIVAGTAY